MELTKKDPITEDLNKLAEVLTESEKTKEIAKAIKNEDLDKALKELEDLKNSSKSMDEKSKEDLKKTISKAASTTTDEDLKNSLDDLAEALDGGDESAISKSIEGISKAVKKGASKIDMAKATSKLQGQLQGQTPDNGQLSQGQGVGQGQGGSGNGSGNGQGQGSGSGSGSGNGAGGSGGIANKSPSAGKSKEYEKVFTPSRLGGEGQTSELSGKSNGNSGGSESYITNDPNATLGELKPYNQVAGEYSNKAMESLNNSEVPDGMKDVIKNYFTSLQE